MAQDGTSLEGGVAPQALSASTLIGKEVRNARGEKLGTIEELMIDLPIGCIAYAVLSFGGILGMGDKLFAVPWQAFRVDAEREHFILDVERQALENAPGFDKDSWPETGDDAWLRDVYIYYGHLPYWE